MSHSINVENPENEQGEQNIEVEQREQPTQSISRIESEQTTIPLVTPPRQTHTEPIYDNILDHLPHPLRELLNDYDIESDENERVTKAMPFLFSCVR